MRPPGEQRLSGGISALSARLPRFPWDALATHRERARAHPGGIADLSVGTPVDPVPPVVTAALAAAADWPGYPATAGTPELRQAACRKVESAVRQLGFETALMESPILGAEGNQEFLLHARH